MLRPKRVLAVIAVACASALISSSCGGSGADNSGAGGAEEVGDPVAGGSLDVIQMGEPRSLDPAALSNTFAHQPTLGNALYGSLIINDHETQDIEYKMATDFTTADGGTTFDLTLRPDLTFTDGTPLDAAAVKYNWDRLSEPALGSTAIRVASSIANTDVVDAVTLRHPGCTESPIRTGYRSDIAELDRLADRPGARAPQHSTTTRWGPDRSPWCDWTRQGEIELEKNPDYWDAPKPYLDTLRITTVADTNQRFNAMSTGNADLSSESSWATLNNAEQAGVATEVVPTGGGQIIVMNSARAPFDDVRARRAVSLALDRDALNLSSTTGSGRSPNTCSRKVPLLRGRSAVTHDTDAAQVLFDELAADGTPLSFTFLSYPTRRPRRRRRLCRRS